MSTAYVSAGKGCPKCHKCGFFAYGAIGYYCESCLTPFDIDKKKISSSEWNKRYSLYCRQLVQYDIGMMDIPLNAKWHDCVYTDSDGCTRLAPGPTNATVEAVECEHYNAPVIKQAWRVYYAGSEIVAREPYLRNNDSQT